MVSPKKFITSLKVWCFNYLKVIFFILIRIPFSCDDRKKILSLFFVSQARNILVVLSLKGNLNKVLIKFSLLGKKSIKVIQG